MAKKNLTVFILLFIVCTISVLIWYPNIDFDFYNYQLYNGWAFVTNRINRDLLVTDFRTYWNPYLDAFQYIMATKLNNHRFIYAILMNLDNVFGLFLTYKIADKVLLDNIKNKSLALWLIVLYVTFSPVMYTVLDSTRNDMFIADLVLIAVYIFISLLDDNCKNKLFKTGLLGCISGIALGFKLTAVIYCLTFLICLFCFSKSLTNSNKEEHTYIHTYIHINLYNLFGKFLHYS